MWGKEPKASVCGTPRIGLFDGLVIWAVQRADANPFRLLVLLALLTAWAHGYAQKYDGEAADGFGNLSPVVVPTSM